MQKPLLITLGLLVVLGAGYTFWWHQQADQLVERVEDYAAEMEERHHTFTYTGIEKIGFPFSMGLKIHEPDLRMTKDIRVLQWQAEYIRVTSRMLEPGVMHITLPQTVKFMAEEGARKASYNISFSGTPDAHINADMEGRLKAVAFDLPGIVIQNLDNNVMTATINGISFSFNAEPMGEKRQSVDIVMEMDGFELASKQPGQTLTSPAHFMADIHYEGDRVDQMEKRGPAMNGSLNIRRFTYRQEPLEISLAGTLEKTPSDFLPVAALKFTVAKFEQFSDFIVEMARSPEEKELVGHILEYVKAISDKGVEDDGSLHISVERAQQGSFLIGGKSFQAVATLYSEHVGQHLDKVKRKEGQGRSRPGLPGGLGIPMPMDNMPAMPPPSP